MKKWFLKMLAFSWVFTIVTSGELLAQCAMCRASVETNVNEDGIGFAAKLNTGILYLFVTPYLLVMVIGYFWYRKSREHMEKQKEAELRKQRLFNA